MTTATKTRDSAAADLAIERSFRELGALDAAIRGITDELRTLPLTTGERTEYLAERGRLAEQRRRVLAELG